MLPPAELRLAAPNWQLGASKPAAAAQAAIAAADDAIAQANKKARTSAQPEPHHKITIVAPSMVKKEEQQ